MENAMAHENRGLPFLKTHGGSFHGELLNDQMVREILV